MCKCPRKHAEVIKAWADGAIIQHYIDSINEWSDCVNNTPSWSEDKKYRIKPEPKPDNISYFGMKRYQGNCHKYEGTDHRTSYDNVKVVWDGETGEIKSVEIIK